MSKRTVEVTFFVEVEMDDSKFDETFMREFSESIQKFDTLDEHAEHIAWLAAKDRLDDFTEGYGPIADMGINANVTGLETAVIEKEFVSHD